VAAGDGGATLGQQWSITSNGDGYLQIANPAAGQVLDNAGSTASGSAVVLDAASSGDAGQEWNLVTAGGGQYTLVNKASGLVLAATASGQIQQQSPASSSLDWISPANSTQLWQVVPTHITEGSTTTPPPTPTFALTASASTLTVAPGGSGNLSLTVTPSNGYGGTVAMSCSTTLAGVTCTFTPTSYTLSASSTAINGAVAINASSSAQLSSPSSIPTRRPPAHALAAVSLCWLPAALGLLLAGSARRRLLRRMRAHLFLALLVLFAGLAGAPTTSGNRHGHRHRNRLRRQRHTIRRHRGHGELMFIAHAAANRLRNTFLFVGDPASAPDPTSGGFAFFAISLSSTCSRSLSILERRHEQRKFFGAR
jgi:Ricin-type beta-trefoil lectin domain-like